MKKSLFKIIHLLAFLLASHGLQGQQGNLSDDVYKNYYPWGIHSLIRYDHYLKNQSFLYGETGSHNFTKKDHFTSGVLNHHLFYAWAGIEYAKTEKWFIGASFRFNKRKYESNFCSRANLSHRGKIKSFYLIKQISLEHINSISKSDISSPSTGQLSLAMALAKRVKVTDNCNVYLLISYKPVKRFLWNGNNEIFNLRRINRADLRLDLATNISNNFMVGIFAHRATEFSYSLIIPEGKRNFIYPAAGFHLNYIFAPKEFRGIIPHLPIR